MGFVFVVIIGIFCLFFLWPDSANCEEKSAGTSAITVNAVKSMSRAEVEAMLQNIERQKAPKAMISAMCYETGMILPRAEYVCPVCGEKTIYPANNEAYNVAAIRRDFAALKKISDMKMELDESSFCKKCCPEAENPSLVLKVTYEDGTTYECRRIYREDIFMLAAFFKGKLAYQDTYSERLPLKSSLPRLRELLGFDRKAVSK